MESPQRMIEVKVKYAGFSREVGIKEEVVHLEGSDYAALRASLLKKHPSLTYIPCICLGDGVPMLAETELKDGDEVTLVEQIGGG